MCVVLTLDATFLAVVLRVVVLAAAFFALVAALLVALLVALVATLDLEAADLDAAFLAGRALAVEVLRAAVLVAVARLALGLAGDFALTARFALFAADLALEREVDRLKPFVRLLLMCGISKGCSLEVSSRGNARELTIGATLNQRAQVFAGALLPPNPALLQLKPSTEKNT